MFERLVNPREVAEVSRQAPAPSGTRTTVPPPSPTHSVNRAGFLHAVWFWSGGKGGPLGLGTVARFRLRESEVTDEEVANDLTNRSIPGSRTWASEVRQGPRW
ncbi:hypothetical protein MRA01_55180 [Methylobacterium radiotolerans]|nr:hypothetical protein MRA01_55180 [Methylobacterium radiotolerans]